MQDKPKAYISKHKYIAWAYPALEILGRQGTGCGSHLFCMETITGNTAQHYTGPFLGACWCCYDTVMILGWYRDGTAMESLLILYIKNSQNLHCHFSKEGHPRLWIIHVTLPWSSDVQWWGLFRMNIPASHYAFSTFVIWVVWWTFDIQHLFSVTSQTGVWWAWATRTEVHLCKLHPKNTRKHFPATVLLMCVVHFVISWWLYQDFLQLLSVVWD